MPKATHGITSETFDNFIVDAGAVYINYGETDERILGATAGGNTFTIETELREMEVDGVTQAVVGQKRIMNVSATMTVNLKELTSENLTLALTGSDMTDATEGDATTPTHDSIRRSRDIAALDYIKNIALIGKVQGKTENFIGILYNALSSGGIELGTEDEGEAVIEATFTAHVAPADINEDGTFNEAWEIRMPK